jgi:predicted histidine transporter YuiF (NhaC family)
VVLCDLERWVLVFQDVAVSMAISMAICIAIGVPVGIAIGMPVGMSIGMPVGVSIGMPVGVSVGVSVTSFLCLCGVHGRVRKAHDQTDFNSSVVAIRGIGSHRVPDAIIYLYPTLFAFGL